MDTNDTVDVFLPLKDLHNVIALDYDNAEKKIYYTDVHQDVIKWVKIKSMPDYGSQSCLSMYM